MSSQIAVALILALFGFGQESRPELLLWQDGTSHSDSFYIDGNQMRSIEHDGTTISTFLLRHHWEAFSDSWHVRIMLRNNTDKRLELDPATIRLIDTEKIAVCTSGEPGSACRQVRGRVQNPTRIREQQENMRVQQTPSPDALPATDWCAGGHSGDPEVLRRPETPQHNPLSKHIRVRPPHDPKPRYVDPGNFAETNHAVSRRDDRTLSLVSTRRNVVVAPGSRLRPRIRISVPQHKSSRERQTWFVNLSI